MNIADGTFHASFVRRRLADQGYAFEVVCPQCGDDGGPAAQLPAHARELRGPHARADAAERAASEHRLRSVRSVTGWAVGGPGGRLMKVAEV